MKRLLLVFCFLSVFTFANAQNKDIDNFVRLEAVGKIPSNLLEIANSNEKIKDNYEENLRNQIKTFILSGKIVFGDTVSNYINNIVDLLLKDDPKLREQIKVYVIKSSQANAFATSKGYLFITTGFIAQSTNEAELAFAISHELIHFIRKHGYSLKDEFDDVNDFLTYHSRSREQEFQCDREGYLNYYTKAGYIKSSSMGVYDILQYSYLPFDEKKLNRTYFENDYYKFKDNYFLESVTPISSRENYIDTFSTHPNLKSRRIEMEKLINANQVEGREFIQSKDAFEHIRTICRFETINQQIMEDNYIKSYYNTLILLDKFPDNKFLRTAKIASIYGISKVKTYGNYSRYLLTKKETEGEIQYLANFFEKANKREIALLALREIYNGTKKDDNKYYSALLDDIINDIAKNMKLDGLNQFSDLKMNEVYVEDSTTKDDNSNLSKYDKIKTSKIIGHQKGFKTENYMLGDLKKDSSFVKRFEAVISKNESKQAGDLINEMKEEEGDAEEEDVKTPKIKTLIVFEPNEIRYDKNNEVISSSVTNSKIAQNFDKMIENIASKNEVKTIIMSNSNFDTNFSYQLRAKIHDFGMGLNRFGEIYYETRDIDNYAKELNTPYLSFISLSKTKNTDYNITYKLIHSIISGISTYPYLPVSIYQWINQSYLGDLNFLIYDLKNYNFAYNQSIHFKYENTRDFEKKALDDNFKQINEKEESIYKKHGYLGKRFIIRLDANLSPAILTPNKFGEKGPLNFDYTLNPNVEFVINKKLSIGAGMSFFDTKFKCKTDSYFNYYPYMGDINATGYSLFLKQYKAIAPIGYYYKYQIDYIKYDYNSDYRETIWNEIRQDYDYKIKNYSGNSYNIGFKIEFGKVFFVNDYIQIGAGCSFGLIYKGWASLSLDEPTLPEFVDDKIRKMYTLGVNLNIGFLTF